MPEWPQSPVAALWFSLLPNVEVIRGDEGAARASHEMCLRKAPDTMIG